MLVLTQVIDGQLCRLRLGSPRIPASPSVGAQEVWSMTSTIRRVSETKLTSPERLSGRIYDWGLGAEFLVGGVKILHCSASRFLPFPMSLL